MNGATLGCFIKGCSVCYHYLCAADAGNKMHLPLFSILAVTQNEIHVYNNMRKKCNILLYAVC